LIALKKIAIEQHYVTASTTHYVGSAHVPKPIWNTFESRLLDFEDHRLAEMDRYGIDMEVLSFGSPGVQGVSDARQAVKLAQTLNDDLAGIIGKYPTRFSGFAAIPTQDPAAAAVELTRAVRELGLKGAMINGQTSGVYLDDPRYWPIFAAAEELGVPLYLHPAPNSERMSLYEGHPLLEGPMWSWGVETATHALRMLFSGVFDAFPKLTVLLGHMGEGLPFVLWRMDSRYKIARVERPLKRLPSEYLTQNFAVTTSGVCSAAPLQCAISALGIDRVLFATDYPFEHNEEAVRFMETAPLSEADRAKIFHENAERILSL
jgi:2,3-dihydroxybenzoate decarboxylase